MILAAVTVRRLCIAVVSERGWHSRVASRPSNTSQLDPPSNQMMRSRSLLIAGARSRGLPIVSTFGQGEFTYWEESSWLSYH